MKVLLCIVNYKSDQLLARLLGSIRRAQTYSGSAVTLTVQVVDNSVRATGDHGQFLDLVHGELPGCEVVFSSANVGYFGALPVAQGRQASLAASVVIFCNADILLTENFFEQLAICADTDAAVLAPAIISDLGNGFDQNPQHVAPVTARKLRRLRLVYSSALAFQMHQLLAGIKELVVRLLVARKAPGTDIRSHAIYAPHGALFVFTDTDFFMHLPEFEPFLFGEELFVAEEARRRDKVIIYSPQLRVLDSRHASTGLLSMSRRRMMLRESIDFILRKYHNL